MRRFIRMTAVLMAVIMTISALTVLSGHAIKVEKDGVTYFLNTRTPAKGDVNVLMVRVGFADYAVDDEESPADSEETLLSYFDGSKDSINAYYENASYGKLRLHCDRVYSYEAKLERHEYDENSYDALSSPEGLITEALEALKDEIGDIDRYDSDRDGYLDYVVFDFAGPTDDWGATWWPHVKFKTDFEALGKHISPYSFLKGEVDIFKHEFGHIIGADDYYSYLDGRANNLMTYDMMSGNIGDHNGFTKWSYGWIEEDQITYVDQNTGDTTVALTPIETSDSGKKIAVIAPSIDRSNGFLGEYFLVEYDVGEKNSEQVFEENELTPGFRIFHVNAKTSYLVDEGLIGYTTDNLYPRNCLIHNVKNEGSTPSKQYTNDMFFREGDSLTPVGYPNTGLSVDDVYNGRFTGISFTDFVTGDHPSFKVSFSDEQKASAQPTLQLEYDEPDAQMKMTIVSDEPIAMIQKKTRDQTPYLLDPNGTKLFLDIKEGSVAMYRYELGYNDSFPSVKPDTEYTLVIPEGCFKYGYNETLPEYRQTVNSSHFSASVAIAALPYNDAQHTYSNIFRISDTVFGRISIPPHGKGKMRFVEYNLNGEPIAARELDAPDYDSTSSAYNCKVTRLSDGNYALEIFMTYGDVHFVKIDGKGNMLSDVYTLSNSFLSEYGYRDPVSQISFDAFKSGLIASFFSLPLRQYVYVTIDFEHEPKAEVKDSYEIYRSIDSDTYIVRQYDSDLSQYVLSVYDTSDQLIGKVATDSTVFNVFADNGNFVVQSYSYQGKTQAIHSDTYTKSGERIERTDITQEFSHIAGIDQITDCIPNQNGYFIVHTTRSGKTVYVYDKSWRYVEEYSIDLNTNLTFVGVCGLNEQVTMLPSRGLAQIVYRFQNGAFKTEPVRILGDANSDGVVNIMDATTIQRYDCKMIDLSDDAAQNADVDRDGYALILDATWLQRRCSGINAPEGIGKPLSDLSGDSLPMS